MRTRRYFLPLSILCLAVSAFVPYSSSAAEPGLIINEDNSHFFTTRTAEEMTLEGLQAFVDQYAGTKVSHLFLSPNSMKASFASTTREAIWELGDQQMPEGLGKQWMDNARLLHERGLDPYAVWIVRCREKGIVPWLSMRMNDIHDVPDSKSYMHSTFWLNHPEFWRVPHDKSGGWTVRALDYGHPEVREHAMSFVRELLECYDPDGLELDWMRFGWHFKAGEEAQGAEILTDFVREVRDLTDAWSVKRGHPIKLGVRVPAHPDAAKGLGMDGVRWAREGLIDMLVPCPFWTSSDFDIPVELWKEGIGEAAEGVVIAPGLEHNTRAWPGGAPIANDLAATAGFAASAWQRGAGQIYLFNYMDSQTRPVTAEEYRVILESGLQRDFVYAAPRRHIQAYRDTVPAGFDAGVDLPVETSVPAAFTLHTGPKPAGRHVVFVAGLAERDGVTEAAFAATVNGASCENLPDKENPEQFPSSVRAIQFSCPGEAMQDGYNEFVVEQISGVPQQIVWAEVRVDGREENWAAAFADRLHVAKVVGEPLPRLTAAYPEATLDDAYEVQRLFVMCMMGTNGIGGFKAAGVANHHEIAPPTGVIPAKGIRSSMDEVVINLADDPNRHVETEIGYIISKAITRPLPDVESLIEHVGGVAAIIELPGWPVEQSEESSQIDMIAWNINAKELIVGSPVLPEKVDPDAVEIMLTLDGTVVNTARGDNAADGQWTTLLKTVNSVVRQGYAVEAGHVISNGALGKILEAEPGEYRADFGPLGEVAFRVK